jgi:hypothetical protein
MTVRIMTLNTMTHINNETQYDTKHNDTQHNGIQHIVLLSVITLSVVILSVVMLSVVAPRVFIAFRLLRLLKKLAIKGRDG